MNEPIKRTRSIFLACKTDEYRYTNARTRCKTRFEQGLIAYSAIVNIWVFNMSLRPMNGEDRCFKKLLISVFLAHILLVEVLLRQFVDQELVSWNEVFLYKTGIKNERLVLKMAN